MVGVRAICPDKKGIDRYFGLCAAVRGTTIILIICARPIATTIIQQTGTTMLDYVLANTLNILNLVEGIFLADEMFIFH
jgi:hypothetical protein